MKRNARSVAVAARFLLFLLGLTGLVALVSSWLLSAPEGDVARLAAFLMLSGGASLGAATLLTRSVGRFARTVKSKLVIVLLLVAVLFALNVGFTAYLMFISTHDLTLLALLLVFSVAVTLLFALEVAGPFASRLEWLRLGVRRLATGDLSTRFEASNIDELDELASALNSMSEALEQATRRQDDLERARRELVASISHDLRSPLATMRAMVESMADGVVSDPETIARYLTKLQGEIAYLSRLIDDLFELSQIDSGSLSLERELTSVGDIISDAVEALSAQASRRRLTITGQVEPTLPAITVDPRQLQRVLYNLLQNALRHTPIDGSIVIRAVDAGPELLISVTDTGEGIDSADLPRVFERFHRGDRARSRTDGGSGLGLTIAKGIVELHGGRIWAQSVLGQGTALTFALPKN